MAFEETSLGRSQQGLKTRYGGNDISRGTVEADKSALALRYAHSHSHASVPCPLSSIAWSLARFRGLAILAVSGSRRGIAEVRPALLRTTSRIIIATRTASRNEDQRQGSKKLTPVRLSPGRLRLATSPNLTRSLPLAETIGIDEVDARTPRRRRRSQRSRPPVDEPNRPLVPAADRIDRPPRGIRSLRSGPRRR